MKQNGIVVVLGNGFDLDMELKTGYGDFFNSNEFAKIDEGNILKRLIIDSKKRSGWIDLEVELKNYPGYYKREIVKAKKDAINKGHERFYNELCESLCEYMKKAAKGPIRIDSVAFRLLTEIYRQSYSGFVKIFNFNYTSPLDYYKRIHQGKPHADLAIANVHGSICDNSIILGVEDDAKEIGVRDSVIVKGAIFDTSNNFNYLIKSHNENCKPNFVRYALSRADSVIFFGHSLGETDYHYFKEFFSEQSSENLPIEKSKSIHIFTRDEASRRDILNRLREMNKKRVNILRDSNKFRIYRTTDEKDREDINRFFETKRDNEGDSIFSECANFLNWRSPNGIPNNLPGNMIF